MSALVRSGLICFMSITHLLVPEYRSAIFYNTPEQRDIAKRVTEEVQKKHFDPKGASFSVKSCSSALVTPV